MKFPELQTARLKLSRITLADSQALFELFSDPQVVKYYDLNLFSEITQAEKLIRLFETRFQAASGIRWGIYLKDKHSLIGTCGVNSWNDKMHHATIGYDLKSEFWNRGMMSEALAAVLDTAFSGNLPCGPLHRIQADTVPGNVASEKVLTKLGFEYEGTRRECLFIRGQYHDLKCYGLLSSNYLTNKEKSSAVMSTVE